jgi:Fe-S oxidoreductase
LTDARSLVAKQLPALAQRVVDGTPILGLEPSCLLALSDEWPELVPGVEAERVAAAAHLADVWLEQQLAAGTVRFNWRPRAGKCLLHVHCHQKALIGSEGTAALLRRIPELDLQVLDAGCCGMAGSFGFECEHYDLSVRIAQLALLPAVKSQEGAVLAAPGTSCRHQIKDLADRRALHPLELVAAALE